MSTYCAVEALNPRRQRGKPALLHIATYDDSPGGNPHRHRVGVKALCVTFAAIMADGPVELATCGHCKTRYFRLTGVRL